MISKGKLTFSKDKSGVSPLIATILLIAFAVSLGAVVMNWTSGAIQENDHTGKSNICESIQISILDKGGEKSICLDRDKNIIVLDIENGQNPIDGLRLSYLAKTSNYLDHMTKVEGGILSHIEIEYDVALFGELSNIKVVPLVGDHVCSNEGHTFSSIPDC